MSHYFIFTDEAGAYKRQVHSTCYMILDPALYQRHLVLRTEIILGEHRA